MNIPTISSIEQVQAALKDKGVCMGKVNPKAYHEWKKKLPNAVSKSSLFKFMASPWAYKMATFTPHETTPAMRWGSLMDCLILTPDLFNESYVVEEINRRTKEGKARAEELEAKGVEVVKPDEMNEARRACNIARASLADLAKDGEQLAMQIGIWVKVCSLGAVKLAAPLTVCGMLDVLIHSEDSCRIVDLKTSSADITSEDDIVRNVMKYGYYMQAAMYTDMLALAAGHEVDGFSLMMQQSSEPYQTRHVLLEKSDIELFRTQYLLGLEKYAEACATDDWGAPQLPDIQITLPAWAKKKLD